MTQDPFYELLGHLLQEANYNQWFCLKLVNKGCLLSCTECELINIPLLNTQYTVDRSFYVCNLMIIFTVRKAENNWIDALGSEIIHFMYKKKKK